MAEFVVVREDFTEGSFVLGYFAVSIGECE